ncbi:TetR/AcrR family transcriptional regulator [Corynebacterium pacaense]|uniref:TetR/AcrR family transcriptional regulator n=1 Tax=Corynebacterium pacaense TaxID=1816684 RepID=UPI0009BC3C3A|nr:TetR/AcrR family transcriptional regulator [Corynebacterium pacaense]
MRADARRRRDLIITTACALFRSHGHDSVTLEQVAQQAGVGIATVYRNFPDRSALDMACAEHLFNKAITLQDAAIASFDAAPRSTWYSFNVDMVEMGVGILVPGLAPNSLDELPPKVSTLRREMKNRTATLISLGQKHGIIHPDIDASTYIVGLFTTSRPPVQAVQDLSPGSSRRLLGIFLTGLEHGIASLPPAGDTRV